MSKSYRARSEIIVGILQNVKEPQGIYRVMYGSMVSFTQVKDYLEELLKHGFVTYNEVNRTYHITNKGEQYLEKAGELHKLMEI